MTDTTTQLAILSDALVNIIDLAPLAAAGKAGPADLLTRAADIAAQALSAAATYGQLPPFAEPMDTEDDPISPRAETARPGPEPS
jgi:hypothetical protein